MRIYTYGFSGKPAPKVKIRKKKRNWTRKVLVWGFRLAAVGFLVVALTVLYFAKDLPDPSRLAERDVVESTKIFARNGELLYEVHGDAKRTAVSLDQVAPAAKQAVIAIEDKDFYRHGGISIRGMLRSVLRLALNLNASGGSGSTLTQQFVKNAILTNERSPTRKLREIILSVTLEARYSKNEILSFYLNEIPWGRNAYGVEAAADSYFGKHAEDLDLAESAYLAALIQSPTRYNPFGPNRATLDGRKDYVLQLMREQGYITDAQKTEAAAEQVTFQPGKATLRAPHFTLWVQDYLAARYGEKTVQEGGLKVYTTLDMRMQEIAERAVQEGVEKNSKKYGASNAALVAIEPGTGQILAMVGSKDYFGDPEPAGCTPGKNCRFEPNVNVAVAERQPGSSFKPYVYLTAFSKDHGYAPATMLTDVVTNFGTFAGKSYIPQDYDGGERGPVSMRKALAGSLNIPAVKTLALVGVDDAVQTARNLGITSPLKDCGLSLVLGGCEVRLVDHVAAYSSIANHGTRNDRTAILKVEDRSGAVLEEYQARPREAVDPEAAYLLTSIMTDNGARTYIFGQNSPLTLKDRPVAAKTGTTQSWRDGWTVGFTPSLAAGVWAGNNDGTLMHKGADGVFVAAPIWNRFMAEVLASTTPEQFQKPAGIQTVTVDEVSGKLPTDLTPTTKGEVFASYAPPKEHDDVHIAVKIDATTGQPATALTPPDQTLSVTYQVIHSERPDDPAWEQPVLEWAATHGFGIPAPGTATSTVGTATGTRPTVTFLSPSQGGNVSVLPLTVSVSAKSDQPIARVDLSVDGLFYQSLTAPPYLYTVTRTLSPGRHTLAATAVSGDGGVGQTSMQFTVTAPENP